MSYFLPTDEAVLTACRGLALSHPTIGLCVEPLYLLAGRPAAKRRVALVAGGGAGHEPLHAGLLGRGGLDAVVPGAIFTSPGSAQITAASLAAAAVGERDAVLYIVKNYTGDRINFSLAADQVRTAGVEVAEVVVDDDLATDGTAAGRRGTGATVVVEKLLGALADQGADLDALAELGGRVALASRSLAVCARAHTSPVLKSPAFQLRPDELDYGVGIHGERAAHTVTGPHGVELLVARMLAELLDGVPPSPHGVIAVISNLGSTSDLEIRIVSALVHQYLGARGVPVHALAAGTYVTALDMAGFSITLTALEPGWAELWDLPTDTPLRLPGAAATRAAEFAPPPGPVPASGFPGAIRTAAATEATATATAAAADPGGTAFLHELHRICALTHADLDELDQSAGDGDFGDNFCGGVAAAVRLAERSGVPGATALAET
ncbi:dihydroxyacetone kinase subunit DhaK, partial [Streptomyces sp. NPDC058953]